MKRLLNRLASKITRPAQETAQLGDWSSTFAKTLLMGGFLGGVLGFLLPFLTDEMESWKSGRPTVPMQISEWRVLYESAADPEKCGPIAQANPACLANPSNPKLWSSAFRRNNPNHLSKLQKRKNQFFWLGYQLNPEELQSAQKIDAYHLLLGRIDGSYRIWVDGELMKSGGQEPDFLPIIIDLTASKFLKETPIRLAIEIFHNKGSLHPDLLGGPSGEGLATSRQVHRYTAKLLFWKKSGPWLFFGLNFVLGFIFLIFWSTSRKKQEYAYLGFFGLIASLGYLFQIDLIQSRFDGEFGQNLLNAIAFYHGAFGLFLGLAFARTRRLFFRYGIPLALILPWIAAGLLTPRGMAWTVSALYLFGGLVCGLQAYWLAHERRNLTCLPIRLQRLVLFGLGLAAFGANHLFFTSNLSPGDEISIGFHLIRIFLFLGISAVVLREYREAERLSQNSPVSEYHRRPVLPEVLNGVALCLDIKGSETLFLHGARRGDSGKMIQICMSHFSTCILSHGGVVIQTRGDQIQAFFPDENRDGLSAALQALERMTTELPLIEKNFHDQNLLPIRFGLSFRAGIAAGSLTPVWRKLGDQRVATWTAHNETHHPVEEAARLMELERLLPNRNDQAVPVAMMEEELAKQIQRNNEDHWVHRDLPIQDRRGVSYRVAVLAPTPIQALPQSA